MKNFKNKKRGIALLFSMLITSIILSIALSILTISVKEINFNTSAKSTNEAFFAADTGVECALYNDRASNDITPFPYPSGTPGIVDCPNVGGTSALADQAEWNFYILNLGTKWKCLCRCEC